MIEKFENYNFKHVENPGGKTLSPMHPKPETLYQFF